MEALNKVKDDVFVVPELFSNELAFTPILQKIFLYLDPKSLKNSKLTCSQWREFIDKRIWGSLKAKKDLHNRLISNWKNEDHVKISKIKLDYRVQDLVGDDEVMLFCEENEHEVLCRFSVYSLSTHEELYSKLFLKYNHMSIGSIYISLVSDKHVTIIDKFTGKTEYEELIDFGFIFLIMVGNTVVTVKFDGHILILQKDSNTLKWTKELQKIFLNDGHFNGVCGDGNHIVFQSGGRTHIWDWRKGMVIGKSVPCGNTVVEFINPYIFTHSLLTDSIKIYDMFTGELIREKEIGDVEYHIQVNQKFVSVRYEDKVSVFDLEEMTNKRKENDQLWRRNFVYYRGGDSFQRTTKSKMLIARGRVVKIYDFWPDRDFEVTEDIESDESVDEDSEPFTDSDWDTLSIPESFEEEHDYD